MRKLKLQVQISIDGFVAGARGEMDWMTFDGDAERFVLEAAQAFPCGIVLIRYRRAGAI